MTILQKINQVKALNVAIVSQETMEEAAPLLVDRQKDQMLGGLNAKAAKIGRYRNPAYSRRKNQQNPLPGLGVPDLRLTGDFYKGIYAEVRNDTVIIDSVDEKTQSLAERYGEEIFGLNKNTKAEAIKDIQPIFMKKVKEAIKL